MSTTLSRAFPTAIKAHRCGSCNGPIAKGEQYHRWTGTGDLWEGVATLKECAECFARYGQYRHLNPENRAAADEWLASVA